MIDWWLTDDWWRFPNEWPMIGDWLMSDWWLIDEWLMIDWWVTGDWLVIDWWLMEIYWWVTSYWWLIDEWLVIDWWVTGDWLMSDRWLIGDWPMIDGDWVMSDSWLIDDCRWLTDDWPMIDRWLVDGQVDWDAVDEAEAVSSVARQGRGLEDQRQKMEMQRQETRKLERLKRDVRLLIVLSHDVTPVIMPHPVPKNDPISNSYITIHCSEQWRYINCDVTCHADFAHTFWKLVVSLYAAWKPRMFCLFKSPYLDIRTIKLLEIWQAYFYTPLVHACKIWQ